MDPLTVAGAFLAGLGATALVRLLRSRRGDRQPWPVSDKLQLVGICVTLLVGIVGIVVPATRNDEPNLPDVRVALAESQLNPAGTDDAATEYVCLVNEDSHAVALTGWTVRSSERVVNVLPKLTLEPGAVVRVRSGAGTASEGDVFGTAGRAAWRNEGGSVALLDDTGREIDSQPYGARDDGDGTGTCGSPLAIALRITSPADGANVQSRTVVLRGVVTPGTVVSAQRDYDNESDFVGGREARMTHLDGRDEFAVRVALRTGENTIRVGGRLPGAKPVVKLIGVRRQAKPKPKPKRVRTPAPRCDPNYKGACVPPDVVDVDCTQIPEKSFRSVGSDPYGLDRDGNGIACEK